MTEKRKVYVINGKEFVLIDIRGDTALLIPKDEEWLPIEKMHPIVVHKGHLTDGTIQPPKIN